MCLPASEPLKQGVLNVKFGDFLYPGMIIGSINRVFQAMMCEVGDIAFVNVLYIVRECRVECYVVSGYFA